ncbi:MAG TPA: helix-turn-helix transcriptional regulator [Pyrinomonadaceae bacterium]|jgi:transcriptional regulator with XRE-family HTH domain|nr:helix-turn-helix transcriptional regulator [Pyrinomonadaceae bacterium]
MGYARRRPERLAGKLLQIRNALGLSQTEMYRRLGVEEDIPYTRISDYELDKSEPTLMVLLQYARVAGVHTEVLIDDELELPEKLPDTANHEEIRRKYMPRRRKR